MTPRIRRLETSLLAAGITLLLLALFGPFVSQPANHHDFADQRRLLGIPHAMDLLSNLPFALWAMLGAWAMLRMPRGALNRADRVCAALFFTGLAATTLGSSWYHWMPDNAGLAVDRLCMVLAFAGLLGLAVSGRISARAGLLTALAFLTLAPAGVWVWSSTGNVLPWVVAQFGGMLLVLVLAALAPRPGALNLRLGAVIACYGLAKLFELADHQVFEWSGELLSGHTLKHVLASCAAWPVLAALLGVTGQGQNAHGAGLARRAAPAGAQQLV
jgi:hypothetical protein